MASMWLFGKGIQKSFCCRHDSWFGNKVALPFFMVTRPLLLALPKLIDSGAAEGSQTQYSA